MNKENLPQISFEKDYQKYKDARVLYIFNHLDTRGLSYSPDEVSLPGDNYSRTVILNEGIVNAGFSIADQGKYGSLEIGRNFSQNNYFNKMEGNIHLVSNGNSKRTFVIGMFKFQEGPVNTQVFLGEIRNSTVNRIIHSPAFVEDDGLFGRAQHFSEKRKTLVASVIDLLKKNIMSNEILSQIDYEKHRQVDKNNHILFIFNNLGEFTWYTTENLEKYSLGSILKEGITEAGFSIINLLHSGELMNPRNYENFFKGITGHVHFVKKENSEKSFLIGMFNFAWEPRNTQVFLAEIDDCPYNENTQSRETRVKGISHSPQVLADENFSDWLHHHRDGRFALVSSVVDLLKEKDNLHSEQNEQKQ